jgi:hypothetical protein
MEYTDKTQQKKPASEPKKPTVGRCEDRPHTRCEDCEFYDYDEELDAYVCQVNLDEDEMISFISGQTGRCPYYRYYDEYKSVHKQI